MASLGIGDVRLMLEIVDIGARDVGTEVFPSAVLTALAEAIPSDACVGYQEADVSGRFRVVDVVEVVGEHILKATENSFDSLGWQNPMHCRLHAHETRVLRLSDMLTPSQKRNLEYDSEVWRPHGIDDGLRLWMPAPPGRARSIYLERSGRGYSDRDVAMLTALRPYLVRTRDAASSRQRTLSAPTVLTQREVEVLDWIALGKTNNDIAALLFISPFTVRQHVENIFEKLDVRTRAAAIAVHTQGTRAPD